ncbi:HNH endonuclease [Pseudidiomarina sp.]|uniref:HNH endonuclease n=1 Tax=Pseudidiomarina sp. TaxID=2081707 RepID=UPI003A972B22
MKTVKHLIFRHLTQADFFNINKPPGTETGGGGQAYIDFPVKSIGIDEWETFFANTKDLKRTNATQGPCWQFPIFSIGIDNAYESTQELKIYQRRAASVSITSQKLQSSRSNRVKAWLPINGFPKPIDPSDRHQCPKGLMVFISSTFDGQIWAGWYLNDGSADLPFAGDDTSIFQDMFSLESRREGYSDFLSFDEGQLLLSIDDIKHPFRTTDRLTLEEEKNQLGELDENEVIETLFSEDTIISDLEISEKTIKIKKRNTKIVRKLKSLYENKCQVTGDEYIFKKKNGVNYTEAHHLIPLGEGGSDSPQNLVVLSPLIHSMLHHADVSPINLDNMLHMEDGSALLDLYINGKPYTIHWHPKHAELFKSAK